MRSETENQKAASWLPEDMLLDQDRAAIILSANPALLLAGDGRLPLWASDAAARALGFRDAKLFMRRRLAEAAPGAQRLAELAASLEEGEPPRLERLRFFVGFRRVSVTALCQIIKLANGQRGLLVAFPADAGEEDEEGGMIASSLDMNTAEAQNQPEIQSQPEIQEQLELQSQPETVAVQAMEAEKIAPPAWLFSQPESAARRMHRFVFTLDAQGTILTISPTLAEIVGQSRACMAGDNLVKIVAQLDETAGLRLEHAIATGNLWNNVALDWPIAGTDLRVPATLAALPAGDGSGSFAGFGRLHLEDVPHVLLPAGQSEDQPELDTTPSKQPVQEAMQDAAQQDIQKNIQEDIHEDVPAFVNTGHVDDEPTPTATIEASPPAMAEDAALPPQPDVTDEDVGETPVTEAIPEDETTPSPASPPKRETPGIITLRPYRAEAPPPANVVTLREGQAIPANGTTPQQGGLSLTERHAFREIAKALGARFDEDAPEENDTGIQGYAAQRQPSRPAGEQAQPTPGGEAGHLSANENADQASFWPDMQAPSPSQDADLTTLLDRLPIGVLVLKRDETLFINRTLMDLTGYPDLSTFKAENGAQAIFRKSAQPSIANSGFDTVVLATRDGEMIPVDAHLQIVDWQGARATLISMRRAVELEQGKALRSVAVDLRRARAEASELRNILDTATDGVLTLDDEGRIISLNSAAEALFSINQNEVVGESFLQLLMNESHADALDYLQGMKANGVKTVLNDGREVYGRERKGGRIPLFITLGHISEEEPRRFCAVLRDLTAWKRAEAQLQEAKRLAENASSKKSDFLTKISHEIRTPINAIIGFAEVMEEERLGPISNPRYKEYLGDIRMSGRHVVSLVNDLLDLAKIEAGRMEMNFAATDINEVITGCVGIIQPQANTNRVLVRSQLAPKLPRVVSDERSVRQIVLNMLSNATRYTQSGGQVIISTALLDNGEAVIRIRDTGVGMTPNELEKALEPFQQVGSNRQGGGTGLGLPLTKALVDANRANFAIRSRPGEGTLVEITFPATRVLAE